MVLLAGQRSQLQADLTEARTLLKLTSRQSSERLERLAAEKEAELSTAQSRIADADRCVRHGTLLCVEVHIVALAVNGVLVQVHQLKESLDIT